MSIEQRFEFFENQLLQLQDAQISNLNQVKAGQLAIYSIVQELAEKNGVSSQDFLKHYKLRHAHMLDRSLRKLEAKDASVAASVDRRKIGAVPTERDFPPLFPPKSPQ